MCDIQCIRQFPALSVVSVRYAGPIGMWPDLSCHDILMNIERETLGAPPGTHVSERALCVRFLIC